MASAGRRGVESSGVVDAGVVLTRLDRSRRSHAGVVALFERASAGELQLSISIVNLAEVFQHARRYTEATGLDPAALLRAYRIAIHSPDANLARRVAALALLRGASLADRFAVATAEELQSRLHTTDAALAEMLKGRRIPVSLH
jgi:predicted nucleic acid-binding protein